MYIRFFIKQLLSKGGINEKTPPIGFADTKYICTFLSFGDHGDDKGM